MERLLNSNNIEPISFMAKKAERVMDRLHPNHQRIVEEAYQMDVLDDEKVANEAFLRRFLFKVIIGGHEAAHEGAGRFYQRDIHDIRVTPEGNGNTLGYTIVGANPSISPEQHLFQDMVIAAASEAGEDLMGHNDHSGCGGDRGRMKILSLSLYRASRGKSNPQSAISEARKEARSTVFSMGYTPLIRRAIQLAA